MMIAAFERMSKKQLIKYILELEHELQVAKELIDGRIRDTNLISKRVEFITNEQGKRVSFKSNPKIPKKDTKVQFYTKGKPKRKGKRIIPKQIIKQLFGA